MKKTLKVTNMTNAEEYINSLSVEEMRYVLRQFWDWIDECEVGCPWIADDEYDCGAEFNEFHERECSSVSSDQLGCWLKYYVWLYRKKKEAGK